MRVSINREDSGYTLHAHRYRVFLDGVEQRFCVMADEEAGVIWTHEPDPARPGHVRRHENFYPIVVERRGVVKVRSP